MFKIITFFTLLAYTFGAPSLPDDEVRAEGRIIGGIYTSIANFPYHVSVEYTGVPICSGSIISSLFVLTAAHCLQYSVAGYTVRAGTSTLGLGGQVYDAAAITIHPGFDPKTFDNNIAVLRISKSFLLGSSVKAVSLAPSGYKPFPGASAIVTGWQTTNTSEISRRLQYLTESIVSDTLCIAVIGTNMLPSRMICTSSGNRGVCGEDLGGPLVSGGVQVGIVSWSNGCPNSNYPVGVYTNVGHFRTWITSVTGIA